MKKALHSRVIGELLNFKSLSRAPVNEQGVVYLFGVLHDFFDFQVESIQQGFPDCTARRKIGTDRWEELRIEFEFESKQFLAHRHDPESIDVIVCWRDNWPDRPKHINVIALAELIPEAQNLVKAIKKNQKPLSAWQVFAQKHRLAGKSFDEISKLWKERDNAAKGG